MINKIGNYLVFLGGVSILSSIVAHLIASGLLSGPTFFFPIQSKSCPFRINLYNDRRSLASLFSRWTIIIIMICEFISASSLTHLEFICLHQISTLNTFVVICRHVQSGKNLSHPNTHYPLGSNMESSKTMLCLLVKNQAF